MASTGWKAATFCSFFGPDGCSCCSSKRPMITCRTRCHACQRQFICGWLQLRGTDQYCRFAVNGNCLRGIYVILSACKSCRMTQIRAARPARVGARMHVKGRNYNGREANSGVLVFSCGGSAVDTVPSTHTHFMYSMKSYLYTFHAIRGIVLIYIPT